MADRSRTGRHSEKNAEQKKNRMNIRIFPGVKTNLSEPPEDEEELEEVGLWQRLRRSRLALLLLLIVLVGAGAYFYRTWFSEQLLTEYSESWTIELKENSASQFLAFGENLVKYDRDGIAYYDASGTLIWTQSYEMSNPIAAKNGDYLVIADQKGTSFYVFNTEGCTGSGSVTLSISRVTVSGGGVVAMILEDTTANYIRFYTSAGAALDIEIKTVFSGDGYPIDLSLSEDGTILMTSFVYLSAGTMKNKVVFYNFSEAGKNSVQRIVGGFEQYGDSIVADVEFLSQKAAVAFAEDRISFYSLKNEVSPELVTEITLEEEILSVFTGNTYVAVVTEGEELSVKAVTVYTASGSVQCEFTVDLSYTGAQFTGNYMVFYNESECRIYTMSGKLLYEGALAGSITELISLGGHSFIQVGAQTMKKITLK